MRRESDITQLSFLAPVPPVSTDPLLASDERPSLAETILHPVAHARSTDPDTSHEAARAVTESDLTARQDAVLGVLRQHGPLIDRELVARYLLDPDLIPQGDSGIRTRRSELAALGKARSVGKVKIGRLHHRLWEAV